MSSEHPPRRLILKRALGLGIVGLGIHPFAREALAAPTPECHDGDEPTEEQIEGPYFKPRSPKRSDLVEQVSGANIYEIEGRVLTRSCRPVAGALLDLWHADKDGTYDETGFRYRGHDFADAGGRYRFRTILPGPYPGRTRHYHLKVQAPRGRVLTTQLYFPADERENDYDLIYSPALLMDVGPSKAGAPTKARFDFILDIV